MDSISMFSHEQSDNITEPTRILVVDDDAQIRTLLRNLLESNGYSVEEAANSQQLLAAIEKNPPRLITLDLSLSGEDGFALAHRIRVNHDIAIIMITAKADDFDRIAGLELGADDYITKPFNLREVLARIRAVLRRYEPPSKDIAIGPDERETFLFADLTFDATARELKSANGQRIDLTTAEIKLLEIFVRRPRRVLSRDTIMDLTKGHEWSPLDRSVDTMIARLRKKIESDLERPSLIKTVRGIGYTFVADITRG